MLAMTAQPNDLHGDFRDLLQQGFNAAVQGHTALFRTDATGLNDLYLDSLSPEHRQFHNCSCCRRFIERFGNLVAVDDKGEHWPVLWPVGADVPELYREAFWAMRRRVLDAKVTGVFLTSESVWGTPEAGGFSHFTVTPPAALVFKPGALTANQQAAKLRESVKDVAVALGEFTPAVLDEAIRVLQADALDRSEKFLTPVQWLRDLHDRPRGPKGQAVLIRAVALAPEGYCHPRSGVIGTLLEDIVAGLSFEQIRARFNAKVDTLQYQRPQAAPTAGAIKAAEALVEKLGIAPSLERRFARLDEIPTIWKPAVVEKPAASGVFGHIAPKDSTAVKSLELPAQTMTWARFAEIVLPTAEEIELVVPVHRANFAAILTAQNAEAPAIMKWDADDLTQRNPFSDYVYHTGSAAHQWGLTAGGAAKVTGICSRPNMWGPRALPSSGDGVLLILAGCVDNKRDQGNALFPETLRSELHGVRSVIEAYSKTAEILGREDASVAGLMITPNTAQQRLRVCVKGAWQTYFIDRWV